MSPEANGFPEVLESNLQEDMGFVLVTDLGLLSHPSIVTSVSHINSVLIVGTFISHTTRDGHVTNLSQLM